MTRPSVLAVALLLAAAAPKPHRAPVPAPAAGEGLLFRRADGPGPDYLLEPAETPGLYHLKRGDATGDPTAVYTVHRVSGPVGIVPGEPAGPKDDEEPPETVIPGAARMAGGGSPR